MYKQCLQNVHTNFVSTTATANAIYASEADADADADAIQNGKYTLQLTAFR